MRESDSLRHQRPNELHMMHDPVRPRRCNRKSPDSTTAPGTVTSFVAAPSTTYTSATSSSTAAASTQLFRLTLRTGVSSVTDCIYMRRCRTCGGLCSARKVVTWVVGRLWLGSQGMGRRRTLAWELSTRKQLIAMRTMQTKKKRKSTMSMLTKLILKVKKMTKTTSTTLARKITRWTSTSRASTGPPPTIDSCTK